MLTKDEKKVVAYYLAWRENPGRFWWNMAPFLIPPVAFAAYGLWKRDLMAMALAFAVLAFFALWYVVTQNRMSQHFYSALRKYEDAVRALDQPDAPSDT
ncbi:MAG TPA: hypothetical protein P5114_10445 [Hyphomicrobiaceae bacterium]|nr:hypothetical protein [Hyphomicrobiaceae bacterium]